MFGYRINHLPSPPFRHYDDVFWRSSRKEEVYRGDDDWTIYYAEIDWEDFLLYQVMLLKKGYVYDRGMPLWIQGYIEHLENEPPPSVGSSVMLTVKKKDWAKLHMAYHFDYVFSPGGMLFDMCTQIEPGPDFLLGKPGAIIRPEEYIPYLEHRARKRGHKNRRHKKALSHYRPERLAATPAHP